MRLVTMYLAPLLGLLGCAPAVSWEAVNERVDSIGVPSITTEELASHLDAGESWLLLDVRTSEEYSVSRLPGAVLVESASEARRLIETHEGPVVAYCSVGIRSARMVEELGGAESGVLNLRGSLFAWANEGRPLEGPSGVTSNAHPYDERWGSLLNHRK